MSKKNRGTDRSARAAAALAEQQRQERRRRNLMVGGVVGAILVIVLVGFFVSRSIDDTTDVSAPAAGSEFGLTVGPDDAPNKVVVYEDFLCPFCREFETSSRDFLRADAKKGIVQVEYRPFHLLRDDYSTRALSAWAAVLQQGTPQQALKLHDLLYDEQPYEQDPNKPGASTLASWAEKAGVTDTSVLSATGSTDAAFVDAADAAANKAGVTGTPTVFLNGKQVSGSSVSDIVDNLERTIAGG
jgi:protein-disulfide isomerase